VLPLINSYQGVLSILEIVSRFGMGSFLAVLKLFGKQNGVLSFPMEGYTLALDFPVNKRVFKILAQIDDVVEKLGGKIYLTKDARMTRELFENTYDKKNLENFKNIRSKYDPSKKFQSLQSLRLGL
jgi:FAD/FMN-containing dehydrogenase